MVNYIKGDVLKSGARLIAHGCNTKGAFGAGVALAVAKKYPIARNQYLAKFHSDGWRLGDVQFVLQHEGTIIANCATQKDYSRGKIHANYDAIRTCMITVKDFAKTHSLTVAVPKIGAGLAGGDWKIIKKILEDVFVDHDLTVYYL